MATFKIKDKQTGQVFTIREKEQTQLPQLQQVEEKIEARPDVLAQAMEKAKQPIPTGVGLLKEATVGRLSPFGALQTQAEIGGGLARRVEAGLGAVQLEEQKELAERGPTIGSVARGVITAGVPGLKGLEIFTSPKKVKALMQGLSGERQAEYGDVVRTVKKFPFQEQVAAAVGLIEAAIIGEAVTGVVAKETRALTEEAKKHVPRVMNDEWFETQANLGRKVKGNLDTVIGDAFDSFYRKVSVPGGGMVDDIPINPDIADDIILKMGFDDALDPVMAKNTFLQQVDDLIPGRIDTIGKMRLLKQLVKSKVPGSYYIQGGLRGKGGITNPRIQKMNVARQLQDEINKGVEAVDSNLGKQVRLLNEFAENKLYPRLERFESIFGKKGEARTQGVSSTFALKNLGTAGERQAIRKTPKLAKEVKKYLTQDYVDDLVALATNSKQLLANMNKYRARQALKAGAVGTGAIYGGGLIRKKLSKD